MTNRKCFAYKEGNCYVTTYTDCRKCVYFKTLDEYIEGLKKYPPNEEGTKEVKKVLGLREKYTGEHVEWDAPEFDNGLRGESKYE